LLALAAECWSFKMAIINKEEIAEIVSSFTYQSDDSKIDWDKLTESLNREILYQLICKLVGPIDPVGETNADEKRYQNLNLFLEVLDTMLGDAEYVSRYKNRQEYSIKRAGERADNFLRSTREWMENLDG
jgi:hypothetical protein